MCDGQYVFTQVMDHLPWQVFRRCVARYGGQHKVQHFSCIDQFRSLAFAQLTARESLRDIEACLRASDWVLWISVDERKLVWSRAARVPWKCISGELGCDRTTAWRRWQLALTKIAARLNAR